MKPLKDRHGGYTRAAPRCPEVEQDHLAAEGLQGDGFSCEIIQREVRGLLICQINLKPGGGLDFRHVGRWCIGKKGFVQWFVQRGCGNPQGIAAHFDGSSHGKQHHAIIEQTGIRFFLQDDMTRLINPVSAPVRGEDM